MNPTPRQRPESGIGQPLNRCPIAIILAVALVSLALPKVASSQPPGTEPPTNRPQENGVIGSSPERPTGSSLSVEAFVYLDEAGDPVVRPAMSWEEFERIRRLAQGLGATSQTHGNMSLTVQGDVDQDSADLSVTLSVDIDSTQGRWVSVPLRMGNFHPSGEFEIVESTLSGDDSTESSSAPDPTATTETDTDDSDQGSDTEDDGDEPKDQDDSDKKSNADEPSGDDADTESNDHSDGGDSDSNDDNDSDSEPDETDDEPAETTDPELSSEARPVAPEPDVPTTSPPPPAGRHRITMAPDRSGFVLWSSTTRPCRLTIQVPAVVRVGGENGLRHVDFDLPVATSRIVMNVEGIGLTSQVIGRGDEVSEQRTLGDRTVLSVDSAGGQFTLQWSKVKQRAVASDMLDAYVNAKVTWDSPQDQPILTSQLTVRNLRGDLTSFTIQLPPETVLLDTPTVDSNVEVAELELPDPGESAGRMTVTLMENERVSRLDLTINLQVRNPGADATDPLSLRVPEVVDAVFQRGELRFLCSEDYRLRWISRPWIQSVVGRTTEELSTRRSYFFDLDRANVALPVWLTAKQRQLRLTSDIDVSLHDSALTATMTVRPSGQLVGGGGLKVDLSDWTVRSIVDVDTGVDLDAFSDGSVREIEVSQLDTGDLAAFQIVADRTLAPEQTAVDVALPRVIGLDDTTLVSDANLRIIHAGRSRLIVDLEQSVGLDPSVTQPNDGSVESTLTSLYRILPTGQPTRLVGTVVKQPQQVSLLSDATLELDGDAIQVTIDWTVTSPFDLEGRLPVRLLRDPSAESNSATRAIDADSESTTDASLSTAGDLNDDSSDPPLGETQSDDSAEPTPTDPLADWIVWVDGSSAAIRPLGKDRYEIVSEQLTDGARSIRWRYRVPVADVVPESGVLTVALPRPDTSEVMMRNVRRVLLRGDASRDLVSIDHPGRSQLEFARPTSQPLRVRVLSKAKSVHRTMVRRAVVRSFLGQNVRHEQVFALVEGGETFRLELAPDLRPISANATIDGRDVPARLRDGGMEVTLPSTGAVQTVQLDVWFDMDRPPVWIPVRPLLQFVTGTERVYWQIVAPRDQHIVWASPTIGRAMSWRFDRWRLARRPTESDSNLATWVGIESLPRPPGGNIYLYVGSSVSSFSVLAFSSMLLWLLIGSIVLGFAALMTATPIVRHPMTGVVAALSLAGLLLVAPDAAVLAGQWLVVSLVLLVIMVAVRALMTDRQASRVLSPSNTPRPATTGSTRHSNSPDNGSGVQSDSALRHGGGSKAGNSPSIDPDALSKTETLDRRPGDPEPALGGPMLPPNDPASTRQPTSSPQPSDSPSRRNE
ncbi:hypothetical protein V7x_17230 [Crateriforma conspicua]|uniref:Uncharacterized protein n=1 Tax=Crateriforma conspicua TaxID=2527996 RepID=A0A5C6FWW7_9PLAN|nr:hypothetical protein [Crateriforma conspicua]TWU66165.1 hypothetical protein V7x_17230 [Crateriforma conspicua]